MSYSCLSCYQHQRANSLSFSPSLSLLLSLPVSLSPSLSLSLLHALPHSPSLSLSSSLFLFTFTVYFSNHTHFLFHSSPLFLNPSLFHCVSPLSPTIFLFHLRSHITFSHFVLHVLSHAINVTTETFKLLFVLHASYIFPFSSGASGK